MGTRGIVLFAWGLAAMIFMGWRFHVTKSKYEKYVAGFYFSMYGIPMVAVIITLIKRAL